MVEQFSFCGRITYNFSSVSHVNLWWVEERRGKMNGSEKKKERQKKRVGVKGEGWLLKEEKESEASAII